MINGTDCQMCGDTGLVQAADVYRDPLIPDAYVCWETARVIECGCRQSFQIMCW